MNSGPISTRPGSPPTMTTDEKELLRRMPEVQQRLRDGIGQRVLGQQDTIRQLLICFIANGHTLVVGVPGLAKTLMIRTLSELLDLDFARIQFTPDLMPSDITGTSILVQDEASQNREFKFRPGPIFANLLLADEINRTPPKTQSSLLEAMEEGQVTAMGKSHRLHPPFFVLATQNPIEQEGTYPLPVTQLDRFLFQIIIGYPDSDTEFEVVATTTSKPEAPLQPILTREEVSALLSLPSKIEIPSSFHERAVALARATRPDEESASATTKELLAWGAGPRGVQAILSAARAAAVLDGRDRVERQDYEEVVLPALRHRILLSYHAEAEGIPPEKVLRKIRREIGDWKGSVEEPEESGPGIWSRLMKKASDTTPPFRKK